MDSLNYCYKSAIVTLSANALARPSKRLHTRTTYVPVDTRTTHGVQRKGKHKALSFLVLFTGIYLSCVWMGLQYVLDLTNLQQKMKLRYKVRYLQPVSDCSVELIVPQPQMIEAAEENTEIGVRESKCEDSLAPSRFWCLPRDNESDGIPPKEAHTEADGFTGNTNGSELDTAKAMWMRVHFKLPTRAVTPQQALVLYDENDVCLGGGLIRYPCRSYFEQDLSLPIEVVDCGT